MKNLSIILLILFLFSCAKKEVKDLSERNNISIPFKLGKVVFDDKRENVVEPKINLSVMPSEENEKNISPLLSDEFEMELESIIQRAFRGNDLIYDVRVIIKKADKYMAKTWKESKEKSEVELVIELTNNDDDASFFQAKSIYKLEVDAPNVTDKHAQELFEKTFKNALYLGLKKVQDDLR